MRKEEWLERKKMGNEHDDFINYNNSTSQKGMEEGIVVTDQKLIENFYVSQFENHVDVLEKKFMNDVNNYFAETKGRLDKKKGGKSRPAKATKK
jgi:hypothetical protein